MSYASLNVLTTGLIYPVIATRLVFLKVSLRLRGPIERGLWSPRYKREWENISYIGATRIRPMRAIKSKKKRHHFRLSKLCRDQKPITTCCSNKDSQDKMLATDSKWTVPADGGA